MPSGPYPTAFDPPDHPPSTSRQRQPPPSSIPSPIPSPSSTEPQPPHRPPPSTHLPSYTSTTSTSDPDSDASSTTIITPNRPPSPAPSYHTLPPNVPSTSTSANQTPLSTLRQTALTHPSALLTTLTLTHHLHQPNHASDPSSTAGSYLSATTRDGKERYRIIPNNNNNTTPATGVVGGGGGGLGCTVYRVDTTVVGGLEAIGWVKEGSLSTTILLPRSLNNARQDGPQEVVMMNITHTALEKGDAIPVGGLLVSPESRSGSGSGSIETEKGKKGKTRGGMEEEGGLLRWEMSPPDVSAAGAEGARPEGKGKGKGKGRLMNISMPVDTHERKRARQQLGRVRLVDELGEVYVEYAHEGGMVDAQRDGKQGGEVWGTVGVRARGVLLQRKGDVTGGGPQGGEGQGLDVAFVGLAGLLDCAVRVLGGGKRGERRWGNFVGVAACGVM